MRESLFLRERKFNHTCVRYFFKPAAAKGCKLLCNTEKIGTRLFSDELIAKTFPLLPKFRVVEIKNSLTCITREERWPPCHCIVNSEKDNSSGVKLCELRGNYYEGLTMIISLHHQRMPRSALTDEAIAAIAQLPSYTTNIEVVYAALPPHDAPPQPSTEWTLMIEHEFQNAILRTLITSDEAFHLLSSSFISNYEAFSTHREPTTRGREIIASFALVVAKSERSEDAAHRDACVSFFNEITKVYLPRCNPDRLLEKYGRSQLPPPEPEPDHMADAFSALFRNFPVLQTNNGYKRGMMLMQNNAKIYGVTYNPSHHLSPFSGGGNKRRRTDDDDEHIDEQASSIATDTARVDDVDDDHDDDVHIG